MSISYYFYLRGSVIDGTFVPTGMYHIFHSVYCFQLRNELQMHLNRIPARQQVSSTHRNMARLPAQLSPLAMPQSKVVRVVVSSPPALG